MKLSLIFFVMTLFVFAATDNREQCTSSFSGIVCYPIDCCNRFVQCVNGVLYPPQDSAPGTNCKNNGVVLASECSSVECPSELPDWGSGTPGPDSGSGGSGSGSGGSGGSGGDSDSAGTDEATGQYKLKPTNHGK